MALPTARLRSRFGQRLMPASTTLLPASATPVQEMLFLYRVRIEEVAARLLLLPVEVKQAAEGDPAARSPSPEPEYDSTGKRTNSREQRLRARLLAARDVALERIMDLNPGLCGAGGPRFVRKRYIPWRQYPNENFPGLIIGPRGNTQKRLEKETNCRISVRGRGATHEGKASRTAAAVAAGVGSASLGRRSGEEDDDEMHVHITGERLAEVEAAADLIADMLVPVVEDAPGNEWKRAQMMEMMAYNGMLSKMAEACNVCGEPGHKQYDCPNRDSAVAAGKRAAVRCALCGDASHVTSDCKLARPGAAGGGAGGGGDALADSGLSADFLSFMAEQGDASAKAVLATQERLRGAAVRSGAASVAAAASKAQLQLGGLYSAAAPSAASAGVAAGGSMLAAATAQAAASGAAASSSSATATSVAASSDAAATQPQPPAPAVPAALPPPPPPALLGVRQPPPGFEVDPDAPPGTDAPFRLIRRPAAAGGVAPPAGPHPHHPYPQAYPQAYPGPQQMQQMGFYGVAPFGLPAHAPHFPGWAGASGAPQPFAVPGYGYGAPQLFASQPGGPAFVYPAPPPSQPEGAPPLPADGSVPPPPPPPPEPL